MKKRFFTVAMGIFNVKYFSKNNKGGLQYGRK